MTLYQEVLTDMRNTFKQTIMSTYKETNGRIVLDKEQALRIAFRELKDKYKEASAPDEFQVKRLLLEVFRNKQNLFKIPPHSQLKASLKSPIWHETATRLNTRLERLGDRKAQGIIDEARLKELTEFRRRVKTLNCKDISEALSHRETLLSIGVSEERILLKENNSVKTKVKYPYKILVDLIHVKYMRDLVLLKEDFVLVQPEKFKEIKINSCKHKIISVRYSKTNQLLCEAEIEPVK